MRASRADAGLAELSPACFGMVMATGIVSLAAHRLAMPRIAQALFELNVVAYAVLWLLSVLRMARHPGRFFADMVDHARGPGFFTAVAATGVLGSQCVMLAADHRAGGVLLAVAATLWAGLTYAIFAGFVIKQRKPALERAIGGAWLLAVVATQSIAVLAALLAAHVAPAHRAALHFLALSMWLAGGMLYIWIAALIFYRATFFALSPADLTPPYWINMGAMAISTLAGSLLIVDTPDAPLLQSMLPFIKGFTVLCWATGTWWIPLLVILAVWRHVVRRYPLQYDPLWWGAVFPLGMYAAGTDEMIEAMGLHFLAFVPPLFFWLGLAAWTAAFVGLVSDVLRRVAAYRSTAA
jgi:tellurite resistance protein TehA-like permease